MHTQQSSDGLLLGFPEYREPAARLAMAAGLSYSEVDIHTFPDGESRLRLPEKMPSRVAFCRSLDQPNGKLLELILAAASAREQGVKQCALVAPYLCYMRQDKAFSPGEVVSQRIIGKLIADYFSEVLTVDAHLHRISRLSEAIPARIAMNLKATEPMARFLAARLENPLLVGPDQESEQWVAAISAYDKLDYVVASKQRFGDRDVTVKLPQALYQGRDIVLLDDVASTGNTLEVAARELESHAPGSVSVLVTHALFVGDAVQRLRAAGVGNIWSCDSIAHQSNAVYLDAMLGNALAGIFTGDASWQEER
ncbi:MAG TPA: phosphoribosylpyrophosphate synthetase [Gammaproteobacteria bacterium]|nr:phosphoribosylpyrophosphate synthetase [Gammaproteobacteria bacterium]